MPNLVAIDLPGGPGFVAALRDVWDRGDAAFPVDGRLSGPAKRALIDRLQPALIVDAQGQTRLPGGQPVQDGDALVIATSGTTGEPRGVVLTHAAVDASAHAVSRHLEVDRERERWLACLPLSHVGGLSVVTRALVTGTPLTVLPGFDRDRVLECAGADVLVSLVPTTLRRIGPEHFRTVVLGGSAPPAGLAPNVVTTYGMTETGSGVVYDGVPLDGVDVAVDPVTSEIRVRGPMLLRSYRDGTDPRDGSGWLSTGDAGWLDVDHRLHVNGRLSEMIITGGENVWPAPVEVALRSDPSVADATVAGRPDPEWGEKVVAWVVPADPSDPPTLQRLREVVAERIAPYAAPRQLVLVDSLPKTNLGKVRRELLPPA